LTSRTFWPRRGQVTLGQAFNPRDNALNALRLFFALLVIFSHSLTLGGYRSEVLWGHATLGDIAVNAFFAISGFLIVASALRNNVLRYLWQRFLRIFPAFWVCLLAIAGIAGPIGWVADGNSLANYWHARSGPEHYIAVNCFLRMYSHSIAGTPVNVPYPLVWNGSLWTLVFEFYCYLMVAALAATTLLRRRRVVLALWIVSWAFALGLAVSGTHLSLLSHFLPPLIRFTPIFFAGAVLWLYRDKIPDSKGLFAAAVLAVAIGTFLKDPDVIAGPPLAYACVWAAIHLPGKRIGVRYDISYGTYIYAFAVAQVLAIWKVHTWGYLPFTLLSVLATLALAMVSCVFVERPSLRLKRWTPKILIKARPPGPTGGESHDVTHVPNELP